MGGAHGGQVVDGQSELELAAVHRINVELFGSRHWHTAGASSMDSPVTSPANTSMTQIRVMAMTTMRERT